MAGPGSRLEKFGTVFTRVSGLLKSGALKPEDKPLWFDIWAAHPPKVAPSMSRALPAQETRDIVYIEDILRAKYYEKYGNVGSPMDLAEEETKSNSQRFIDKYMQLERSSPPKGNLLDAVQEALKVEGLNLVTTEVPDMKPMSEDSSVKGKTISEVIMSKKDLENLLTDDSSSSSDSSSDSDSDRNERR